MRVKWLFVAICLFSTLVLISSSLIKTKTDNFHPSVTSRRQKYEETRSSIEGAMHPSWPRVIDRISEVQLQHGIYGSIGEIGVHHGLFYGALASNARENEKLWAADLFSKQELNFDKSGKGDLDVFKRNMKKIGVEDIHIIEGDSMMISPSDVLSVVGKSRLISIDGGHSKQTTLSDLFLSKSLITTKGLIILDDIFNTDWLGVVSAHFEFMSLQNDIVPIAYKSNKLIYSLSEDRNWWVDQLRDLDKMNLDASRKVLGKYQLLHLS